MLRMSTTGRTFNWKLLMVLSVFPASENGTSRSALQRKVSWVSRVTTSPTRVQSHVAQAEQICLENGLFTDR